MIADETEGERTMIAVASVSNAASELAKTFLGQLLTPADAGYEDARQVHNGLIDKRPALIVRCHGVADVVVLSKLRKSLASRSPFAEEATTWLAAPLLMAG